MPPNKFSQLFRDFAWKVLFYLISMGLIIKDKICDISLDWYLGDKKSCPPLKDEHKFLAKSATELATLIKNGELKAVDLVQATIDRMKEVCSTINNHTYRVSMYSF